MSVFRPTAVDRTNRVAVRGERVGPLRQVIDALVCLSLAVILFRGFEVEGYMISTGSMAPSLLGFHKRVICPTCGCRYTYGVSFDDMPENEPANDPSSSESADPVLAETDQEAPPLAPHSPQYSTCPNCGQREIDVAEIPRNQGDQLLVNKSAYEFENPQRWEVIVFRNPLKATQAYVKRAIGLPGEKIQIIDGDIYADGRICRKDIETQRAMRIPVFDNDFAPTNDSDWRERWVADLCAVPWRGNERGFVIDRSGESIPEGAGDDAWELEPLDDDPPVRDAAVLTEPELRWSWVTYHHTIRSGGTHQTVVELDTGVPEIRIPQPVLSPVRYEAPSRRLICIGALSAKKRDELIAANTDPGAVAAIQELYRESHFSPVTDDYGYNQPDVGLLEVPVRDLMFTADVALTGGSGAFVVEMTDGRQAYECVFDLLHREARLHVEGSPRAVRTAPLAVESLRSFSSVEMSLIDRQVIVTLNGVPLFESVLLDEHTTPAAEMPRSPVRFGARGLRAEVQSLVLYRDVHYTRGRARNGVEEPYQLGPAEYFVLGDNSPVSADSRSWAEGAVPAHLLVGKPFVVHLPSRPGKLTLGGTARYIRIPDFVRMRYIR